MPDPELGGDELGHLAMGGGLRSNAVYARLFNPTVGRFEAALSQLENAEASVAFASGMAALTALVLAAKQKGGHMVAVRPMYGSSDHLLASGLLGMEVSFCQANEIAAHLREDTSLVFIETPANPTLDLLDIADIVRQAGDVAVAVDSTFATPVLQRPIDQGAAIVLHSGTKFLGGHGDVVAGTLSSSEEWAVLFRQMRVVMGALLHPLGGYLLHRGLQTLPLRVRAAQEGARSLAERLTGHPAVEKVFYPGLPGGDPKGLVGTQLKGPGSLLSFELKGGEAAALELMKRVKLALPAVSLGSCDTLIQHPWTMTHRVVPPADKLAGGITEGLVRLSVGIEDPNDLWADLSAALGG
jgi:methionine-gamma-lyase